MTHAFSVPCQLGNVESLLQNFGEHLTRVSGTYGINSPTIESLAIGSYRLKFKLTYDKDGKDKEETVDAVAILVPQGNEFDVSINDNNDEILRHFEKLGYSPAEALRTLFLIAIDLETPDPAVEHALESLRTRGETPGTGQMSVFNRTDA